MHIYIYIYILREHVAPRQLHGAAPWPRARDLLLMSVEYARMC